MFLLIF